MSVSGIEWTPGAEWDVAEPEEAGFDRARLAHAQRSGRPTTPTAGPTPY